MSRYILRLGGRVLATALFTGAFLLGFVAPSAAGEFVLWTGVFTPDGCKVTAVDQSTSILPFDPVAEGHTCSELMNAIQTKTGDFVCDQRPTQSHIVPPPPLGLDDLSSPDEPVFLEEELVGRVFRVGVTGEARCEPTSTTAVINDSGEGVLQPSGGFLQPSQLFSLLSF